MARVPFVKTFIGITFAYVCIHVSVYREVPKKNGAKASQEARKHGWVCNAPNPFSWVGEALAYAVSAPYYRIA